MKLVNVPRCCSLVTREFRPRAAIKVNKCDLERRERTTWESGMHSSVSWHNTRHRFVREISWNRYVRYRWWPLKDRPQIITPTPPTKCINLLNHGNVLTLNQGGIWACHVGGKTFTPEFQMSRNLRKILCQPRDNFRFDGSPCANYLAQLLQKFYSPEIKNVYWLSRISKSKEIGLFLCWRKEEEEIKEKKGKIVILLSHVIAMKNTSKSYSGKRSKPWSFPLIFSHFHVRPDIFFISLWSIRTVRLTITLHVWLHNESRIVLPTRRIRAERMGNPTISI